MDLFFDLWIIAILSVAVIYYGMNMVFHHECGHAMPAKKGGLEPILVFKTWKKSYKTYTDGIPTYYINRIQFHKKYELMVGGFCTFKGEDNPDLNVQLRNEITAGGYKSDYSILGKGLTTVYFAVVTVMAGMGCYAIYEEMFKLVATQIPFFVFTTLFFFFFIFVSSCAFFYIYLKRSNVKDMRYLLKRAQRKVKKAVPGSTIHYTISDGTKLAHMEEYIELLREVKAKNLSTEDDFDATLAWAESLV